MMRFEIADNGAVPRDATDVVITKPAPCFVQVNDPAVAGQVMRITCATRYGHVLAYRTGIAGSMTGFRFSPRGEATVTLRAVDGVWHMDSPVLKGGD